MELLNYPVLAKKRWAENILCARIALAQDDLLKALSKLTEAKEMSELLLELEPCSARAEERYTRNCIELGYVYRLLGRHLSLQKLYRHFQLILRKSSLYYSESDLLAGIEYVIDCEDIEINNWLSRKQHYRGHLPSPTSSKIPCLILVA